MCPLFVKKSGYSSASNVFVHPVVSRRSTASDLSFGEKVTSGCGSLPITIYFISWKRFTAGSCVRTGVGKRSNHCETMGDIQQRWDQRWREKASHADQQTDPWLQQIAFMLVPGKALDVACGMGRNAVYLAERGFSVTAVDVSPVALDLLKAEAEIRGLDIETRLIDLESQPRLPDGPFDLLLNIFYLHRPLLPDLLKRVTAGGMAVFRTFSRAGPAQFGSVNPEFALRPGELLEIFAGWDVLFHEEGLEPSRKGGSLAGIVARKIG